MRMVVFLTHLLRAHAETLQLLSAALGQEEFLALLDHDEPRTNRIEIEPQWFVDAGPQPGISSPYQEIEGAVREMGLPAVLEFYLWAYPTYRSLIESSATLDSRIDTPETAQILAELCIRDARSWLQGFPVPETALKRLEKLTESPWLKFRSEVLTQSGRKRLRSVE